MRTPPCIGGVRPEAQVQRICCGTLSECRAGKCSTGLASFGVSVIISNQKLLATFRVAGRCEWCGRWCQRREAVHVFACGHGGGRRLDVYWNLLGCGLGAWSGRAECLCHGLSHEKPAEYDFLAVVAAREGLLQDDIRSARWVLDRLPRDARPWQVERELNGENEAVKRLVSEALGGA